MPTENLINNFSTKQEELEANRQGRLSAQQQENIRNSIAPARTALLIFVIGWCLIFGTLIVIGIQRRPEAQIDWGNILGSIIPLSFVPLLCIFMLYRINRTYHSTEVHSCSGVLKYISIKKHQTGIYYPGIEIDGKQFRLSSWQAQKVFIEGAVYRVYYFKYLLRILSAEQIIRKSKME